VALKASKPGVVEFDPLRKKQLFSLRDTAMQLRSQRPLHVQGDVGHPGYQGGGPKRIIVKKWRAEEEVRHKGSLTPKKASKPALKTC
jgi:hypothetical protein